MNNNKINLAIVFGGKSAEHEVSLQSAKNILEAAKKDKYNIFLIGIDKGGKWYYFENHDFLKNKTDMTYIDLSAEGKEISFTIGNTEKQFFINSTHQYLPKIDVIFPIVHGTNGEDGSFQGFFNLLNIPYVGADVLGSSVGMDKDVMKKLFVEANLPIGKFISINKTEIETITEEKVKSELGFPVFVKPANMGSSIGVTKASNFKELRDSISTALKFDSKVVIEEFIKGREVECAVLGNYEVQASTIGEIITNSKSHDFYSYEAKYLDENGAILQIPAKLDSDVINELREKAVEVFKVLNCFGIARVDFFVTDNNQIFINEINTLPGFTKISMYPKLWEYSGVKYSDLIDRLVELAVERNEEVNKLQVSFEI